jgi:hypothetical protein
VQGRPLRAYLASDSIDRGKGHAVGRGGGLTRASYIVSGAMTRFDVILLALGVMIMTGAIALTLWGW